MPISADDLQALTTEHLLRGTIRKSFLAWAQIALANAGQVPALHHRRLITELEAVSRGETDRLIVLMPPGSAKSTYGSILFPVWWFTQHPASAVLAVSHTADLASHFGRMTRNLVAEHHLRLGYALAPDKRAAASWHTTARGVYHGTGARGPIVGRRADLMLIDDPVKSQAEADNATQRDNIWSWYRVDLMPRLKPGGRVVVIMTRWHEDDLGCRLLQSNEKWRSLVLPAIAEEDDALGRPVGAALWPDWENTEALARKRASVGERAWSALFQQRPRPLTGGLFKPLRVVTLEAAPAFSGSVVRAWDLAGSRRVAGRNPDWTVGLKLMRESNGRFVILDVVRLQGGPHEVETAIANTAGQDGPDVTVGLPQDPGLCIVRARWNTDLLEELGSFPTGAKDDQVDALSRAFGMLTATSAPARTIRLPLLAR